MNLQKNDLVELNYNSTDLRLAKIIHVGKNNSEALDLSNNEKIILYHEELYDKQDITGNMITPQHEQQMKMLGANNLWVRLSKKQYNQIIKIKNQKEVSESIKEIDEKQIEKLKKWFADNKEESEENKEKIIDIFSSKQEDKNLTGPLSRFVKRTL